MYDFINKQPSQLHIIHWNVCSLRKHFNELLVFLEECIDNLDVICLTEINIKREEMYRYQVKGFNMYIWTREERRGGGILLYIKNEFTFVQDEVNVTNCEMLKGELQATNFNATLLVIYRPPDTNKTRYISEVISVMYSVPKNKNVIMLGDVNINILEHEMDTTSNRYLNTLSELGLQCGVRDVTRECVMAGRRVASCIDHVFVRTDRASALQAFTVRRKVADHYMTGLSADIDKQIGKSTRTLYNNNMIAKKLHDFNWSNLLRLTDPIDLYCNILDVFQDVYRTCTYQRKCVNKRFTQPWVDKNLLKQLEIIDLLFRKWKANPKNICYRLEYTRHRNYTNKLINQARNEFRKNRLRNCNGDMRKIWSTINDWLGRSKLSVDSVIEKYMLKTKTKADVCEDFCSVFTREIEDLKNQHQCSDLLR